MADSAGTMTLIGQKTKRTYCIDLFLPDAVATTVKFNPSGKAVSTSSATIKLPEDCVIVDIATATAPTATGGVYKINDAVINGGCYRYAERLNTLATRSAIVIPVPANAELSILQH